MRTDARPHRLTATVATAIASAAMAGGLIVSTGTSAFATTTAPSTSPVGATANLVENGCLTDPPSPTMAKAWRTARPRSETGHRRPGWGERGREWDQQPDAGVPARHGCTAPAAMPGPCPKA